MKKQKLVLIGNGMAGMHCIEKILELDRSQYEITIFGSEAHVNYSRILLSSVLQGDTSFDDITINKRDWYKENNLNLYTNETVIDIDKKKKLVKTDKRRIVHYDKLILATGSNPIMLPIPGAEKEGVITFRTIEDCQKMMEVAKHYKKAAVIGGGLLGLEAARGLLNLGMSVSVIHLSDRLMNKQLDKQASKLLQRELEQQGMNFLLEKDSKEIVGHERVEGIHFKDGTSMETDLVVMAVGIMPNIALAKRGGIATNRGIIVNDFMETDTPNIFAVGECAEHNEMVYGLVKPLYEQGTVLANHLCSKQTDSYKGSVLSTQLKVSGVDVFSVGQFSTDEATKAIQFYDEITPTYKKLFLKDNKAVGAVLYGDIKSAPTIQDIIVKNKFIPDKEMKELLLSQDSSTSYPATLPRNEYICTCNNVTKGTIIDEVITNELKSVDDVKEHTKASSSCGGCKPTVSALLDYIYSEDFNESVIDRTFCSCTTLTEDEVVAAIQQQELTNVPEIMKALNWKDLNGCRKCLPALEYHLGIIYPEYEYERRTVFQNEKRNALLLGNGTYSVAPQLYGGMVHTKELRRIVAVAEKYGIHQLSITSDQRLHLSNIREEHLDEIWTELDMPLHSTSANTVQNVKVSNGNHLCDCDKHPAYELAVELEKRTEFLKVPYRIRIGVSACMHNGAGSTTKDVGVMKNNRGWEIYVGGSSGRDAKAAQLLCVSETREEALEIIIGFIMYYRESANYLERTWQWMNRISLVHIREVLFNDELRNYLIDNLKKDIFKRKKLLIKS